MEAIKQLINNTMYTIKEIIENNIGLKPMTKEQFDILYAELKKEYLDKVSDLYYNQSFNYRLFLPEGYDYFGSQDSSYVGDFECTKEISFSEIDFNNVPDFTVKGTKLPVIPEKLDSSIMLNTDWSPIPFEKENLISFGITEHLGNICILAEKANYTGNLHYIFKLSDIQNLYKQQNNIMQNNKTIIGYKCPTDLFGGKVKAGTIYKVNENTMCEEFNTVGWTANYELAHTNMPLEIVTTWEPVYEEQYKAGDYITVIKGCYGHDGDKGKTYLVTEVNEYGNLHYNTYNSINISKVEVRLATPEEIEAAQTKTFNMNGFDIVVKGGKAYHGTEDITAFVTGCNVAYNNLHISYKAVAGYDFIIGDVILSKTGCQNKETKLSQWIKVYNYINSK